MFFMFLSVLLFLTSNIFVKDLDHIPFFNWVLYRGLFIMAGSFVYLKVKGISPWGNRKSLLLLRGLFGTIGILMFLYTVQNLPLGIAITLQYTSPIFTILFAGLFLKEWPQKIQWLFFALALIGVYIVKESPLIPELFPLIVGLLAASMSGFAYTTIRALRKTDHPLVVMIYFTFVTVPLTLPYVIYKGTLIPKSEDLLGILLFASCNFFAQIFLTHSLQQNLAHRVSLMKYVGVVLSFLIGLAFFDEQPEWVSMIGVLLILLALYFNSRFSARGKG